MYWLNVDYFVSVFLNFEVNYEKYYWCLFNYWVCYFCVVLFCDFFLSLEIIENVFSIISIEIISIIVFKNINK